MSKEVQSQYGGLPLEVSSSTTKDTSSLNYASLPSETANKSTTNNAATNISLSSNPTQKRSTVSSSPLSQYGGLPEPAAPTAPIHITQYGGLTEHIMGYGGMPNAEASKEVFHQYGGLPNANNSSTNSATSGSDSHSSSSSQQYGGLPGSDPLAPYRGLPPSAPASYYGGLPASSKPMSPTTSAKQQRNQAYRYPQTEIVGHSSKSNNKDAYLTPDDQLDLLKTAQQQ